MKFFTINMNLEELTSTAKSTKEMRMNIAILISSSIANEAEKYLGYGSDDGDTNTYFKALKRVSDGIDIESDYEPSAIERIINTQKALRLPEYLNILFEAAQKVIKCGGFIFVDSSIFPSKCTLETVTKLFAGLTLELQPDKLIWQSK